MPQIQRAIPLGGDSTDKVLAVHMGGWEMDAQGTHEVCWSCALLKSWGAYGEIAGGDQASSHIFWMACLEC